MASPINTIGKAVRHNMLIVAECECGNVRYYRAADLMMVFGGGRDPVGLPFTCDRCKPQIRVKLLEPDSDFLPRRLIVHKPVKDPSSGRVKWVKESRRG